MSTSKNMSLLDAPQIIKYVYDEPDNAIRIITGAIPPGWDTVNVTYPINTTEVYTFLANSAQIAQITIVYTDSTKANLLSVVRNS